MTKEFYQILEITETATAEEIKKAYRKLALKWHPDKWSTKSLEERGKANEEMQKVNKAYEVLGDEEKKRRYDLGETSFSTARDTESFEEYVRRMNEQDEAEIEEINEKLEKLKRIAKILFRSEIEGIIRGEALLNGVWERHFNDMDSDLWTPYNNWAEKVQNIEIGDDENDKEGIDKKELNEFKEKMIRAIRERGVQLKAEKEAKANSDLERAKLKSIEVIEKELKDRGLKIEDLEEEYHNYKEEINSLTKKSKIRSYEDKVMEAIRQKSQGGKFETKQQGDFNQQEKPGKSDKEAGESEKSDFLPSDAEKIDGEMKPIEFEKLQSKILTDDMNNKVEKKEENGGRKSSPVDKDSAINSNKSDDKKNLLKESKRGSTEQQKNSNIIVSSDAKTDIIKKSQEEAKNKSPTLLVVGIMLIISSAFALGYWLSKKYTKKIN